MVRGKLVSLEEEAAYYADLYSKEKEYKVLKMRNLGTVADWDKEEYAN